MWGREWASSDGILGSRAADFDSGSAATNAIELTKRHPTVSLTKQGAATGNLRVNLSWRMRTSDIGGLQRESGLLRHPFKAASAPRWSGAQPEHGQRRPRPRLPVRAGRRHARASSSRWADFFGDLNAAPYVKLSGDDRFGRPSGETMYVNLDHRDEIKRLLVFVYIYDQTPAFDRTHADVTLYPSNGPRIEIELDERAPQARSCAVVLIENVKGELVVRREVKFVYGFQAELDRLYGWGLQWGRGYKTKA